MWFLMVSIPLSILMAQHNLAFKTQEKAFFLDSFKAIRPGNEYFFVHVLGANCGCSKRVLAYLTERSAPALVQEKIILVEGSLPHEEKLLQAGIEIEKITPEELKSKYGLESAPQFFVLNREGKTLYAGGYKKYEETDFRDIEIFEGLKQGRSIASYPVFGCAFGKKLKDKMDPFKFKYTVKD